MTSRCSSASRRVESALEPTMSQNMMVSCRRSAEGALELIVGVLGVLVAGAEATFPVETRVQHLPQKLFSAGTVWPQVGHVRGRAMPHMPQKLLPSDISALQPGHCKRPAPPRIIATV